MKEGSKFIFVSVFMFVLMFMGLGLSLGGCATATRVTSDVSCDLLPPKIPVFSDRAVSELRSKDLSVETRNELNTIDDFLLKLRRVKLQICSPSSNSY